MAQKKRKNPTNTILIVTAVVLSIILVALFVLLLVKPEQPDSTEPSGTTGTTEPTHTVPFEPSSGDTARINAATAGIMNVPPSSFLTT